jgi:hypothetical protein
MLEEDTQDDRGDPEEPGEADEGLSPRELLWAQTLVWVLEGAAALLQIYSAGVTLHWW